MAHCFADEVNVRFVELYCVLDIASAYRSSNHHEVPLRSCRADVAAVIRDLVSEVAGYGDVVVTLLVAVPILSCVDLNATLVNPNHAPVHLRMVVNRYELEAVAPVPVAEAAYYVEVLRHCNRSQRVVEVNVLKADDVRKNLGVSHRLAGIGCHVGTHTYIYLYIHREVGFALACVQLHCGECACELSCVYAAYCIRERLVEFYEVGHIFLQRYLHLIHSRCRETVVRLRACEHYC